MVQYLTRTQEVGGAGDATGGCWCDFSGSGERRTDGVEEDLSGSDTENRKEIPQAVVAARILGEVEGKKIKGAFILYNERDSPREFMKTRRSDEPRRFRVAPDPRRVPRANCSFFPYRTRTRSECEV